MREFSFYRNPGADMLYSPDDLENTMFEDAYALHFCSVSLGDFPMKEAHKKAIDCAIDNNSIISFDPNVRLPLWNSEDECRKAILEFLPFAHIVKISDEELEFITGFNNIEDAKEVLFNGSVKMVIFTKGKDGAEIYTKDKVVSIEGNVVEVVDTTGAGDSFIGAFLFKLLENEVDLEGIDKLSCDTIRDYLLFANHYAAYSTTKKGAIASYANLEEIQEYIKNR